MTGTLLKATLAGLLLIMPACDSEPSGHTDIQVLRIGVLPDQDPNVLRERFVPLFDYLTSALEVPYEFVPSDDYAALVRQFVSGDVDLAYFGGFTFLEAEAKGGAVPLIMRDVDKKFVSYFLVRPDNPAKSLADLKGGRICFGSRLSTSGHLMPRSFLAAVGIWPEDYFSDVCYTGAHDRTALQVRDGAADIGVANAEIIQAMLRDGRLSDRDIRILAQTPPYPDYVWAASPRLGIELQQEIRDAFLDLSPGDDAHARLLGRLGAGAFLPASSSDFAPLRETVEELGLLNGGA